MAETFTFQPLVPAAGRVGGTTALERAAEIVEGARSRAEAIAAEARDAGHAEGYAAGLEAAHAAVSTATAALAEAAAQIDARVEEFCREAERHAVDLAVQLAEKIIAARVEAEPEAILGVVSGALRGLAVRDQLVVEVNPVDFALVRGAADDLAAHLGGIRRLEVISERRVARGGCIVRTEQGEVDARIDEQLAAARSLFAGVAMQDERG